MLGGYIKGYLNNRGTFDVCVSQNDRIGSIRSKAARYGSQGMLEETSTARDSGSMPSRMRRGYGNKMSHGKITDMQNHPMSDDRSALISIRTTRNYS